jgi:hypothetical protein
MPGYWSPEKSLGKVGRLLLSLPKKEIGSDSKMFK